MNNRDVQDPKQTPQGLFNLTQSDWDKAKRFFQEHPSETKMPKKVNDVPVAFIKVNNVIYAKATGKVLLGEGTFGKVKLVQTEAGEQFAVKVEGRGRRDSDDAEAKIMTLLGVLQGEAEREYNKDTYKGHYTSKKLYTVMTLHDGDSIFNFLYADMAATTRKNVTTNEQNLILAIKAAESIQFLHNKNVYHSDIRSANFMANMQGDLITVSVIDFGFAKILPDKQTRAYLFPKDIYSLGRMLKVDLQLDLGEPFYNEILNDNRDSRPDISKVLDSLYKKLESQPNLSAQANQMIEKHKAENQQQLAAPINRQKEKGFFAKIAAKFKNSRDKTTANPSSPDPKSSQENSTKLKK